MSHYQISPSASQDLNQISEYFLSRNITAGERFFQDFNRKCKYLTQFPYISPFAQISKLSGTKMMKTLAVQGFKKMQSGIKQKKLRKCDRKPCAFKP